MLESLERWQMNRKTCRIKVKESQNFHKLKILQERNITGGGGTMCPPPAVIGLRVLKGTVGYLRLL